MQIIKMRFSWCLLGCLLLAACCQTDGKYTCPRACKCNKDFTNIDCKNAGIIDVPDNIPNPVRTLNLAKNSINTIQKNAFSNLKNLKHLDLRGSQVRILHNGSFSKLENLQMLFLTGNTLQILYPSVCDDIPMLKDLYLGQNKIKAIPDLGNCTNLHTLLLERNSLRSPKFPSSYLKLTNLNQIGLSNNDLGKIAKDDFAPLVYSPITKLSLSRDKLTAVEKGSFQFISSTLTSLKISYNSLNGDDIRNLCDDLGKGKHITSLNFDGMRNFRELPSNTFRGFAKGSLRQLSFRHTDSIGKIEGETFIYLKKLYRLDISYSRIQQISPDAFKGLNSLQELILNKNDINGLPHSLPKSLKEVNLQDNRISEIPDYFFAGMKNLLVLNLKNNNILKLGTGSFAGLEHLRYLNLSGNHIDGAGVETFSPLRKLRSLSLKSNRLTKIVNNPRIFEKLATLEFLDLSENRCSVLPMSVFQNLKSLRILKMTENNLGHQLQSDEEGKLFAGLENLEELFLESNSIRELTRGVFKPLRGIQKLGLSGNAISNWKIDSFQSQNLTMKHLNLSRNNIATINESSMADLKFLVTLTLTSNPFSCDCALVWFRKWINTTNVTLPELQYYTCNSPATMSGVPLLKFDPDSLTCIDLFPYILGGSLSGAVVLFLVLTLVMYRYRWFIKLRVYRIAQAVNKHTRAPGYEPIPGDDLRFDAYISNERNDRMFVLDNLLPQFDDGDEYNGEFKLCFNERDIVAADSPTKNVADNIENSRRGLIVLSPAYLSDKFLELELYMLLKEANQRPFGLIVIQVADVPPDRIPKGLRRIFEVGDQLTWSEDVNEQRVFRDRLINKLGRPPQGYVDAMLQPAQV